MSQNLKSWRTIWTYQPTLRKCVLYIEGIIKETIWYVDIRHFPQPGDLWGVHTNKLIGNVEFI